MGLPRSIQAAIGLLSLGTSGLLIFGLIWVDDQFIRHRSGVFDPRELLSPVAAMLIWVPFLTLGIIGLTRRAPRALWLSLIGTVFPLVSSAFIVRNNRRGWANDFLLELTFLVVFLAVPVTLLLGRRSYLAPSRGESTPPKGAPPGTQPPGGRGD